MLIDQCINLILYYNHWTKYSVSQQVFVLQFCIRQYAYNYLFLLCIIVSLFEYYILFVAYIYTYKL